MRILLLLLLSVILTPVFSQINFDARIELDLKDYDNFKTYALGENGLLLLTSQKAGGGEDRWEFSFYDKDLTLLKAAATKIDKSLTLNSTYVSEDKVYSFFKRKDDYVLITANPETAEIVKVEGKLPKKSTVEEIAALGEYVYLKMKIKRDPGLLRVNWNSGDARIISLEASERGDRMDFEHLQVDEESQEVFAFVSARYEKREGNTYGLRFDESSKKTGEFRLSNRFEENMVGASASKIAEEDYVFVGTYADRFNGTPEGIYMTHWDGGKMQFLKKYPFAGFEDFFKWLPERKQKKIERKKERRGDDFVVRYRIAEHNVIPTDDGYIFLGEAYSDLPLGELHGVRKWSHRDALPNCLRRLSIHSCSFSWFRLRRESALGSDLRDEAG